ncbi:MAG: DUF2330 domain-containing protein [Nannocystaceae bacterium]
MRDRRGLLMQNNYQGPPQDFAMVVPVPVILQEESVKTLPHDVFGRVDQLTAPRLVEYWEQDPCAVDEYNLQRKSSGGGGPLLDRAKREGSADDLGVTIEAQFTVGEYQILILSAEDAAGLDTWLRREAYSIPAGAEALLRPYVESGMKFFVAKVDIKKVKVDAQGRTMLSPLRFHYDSPELRLPVRLGLINSGGTQDLLVHVLARGKRYELANYPNVTIPTNLEVAEEARERFGELYAALFDATLERSPGAAVTEYAWDAGSCDPCPTPPLTPDDLATLGADVLDADPGPQPVTGRGRDRRVRRNWSGGFVVTRLHLRYGKESLGEDLIFREAPPIVGGREFMMGDKLERGAREDYVNNFQARYAIRHPWTGPITCQSPERGRWGGPPGSNHNQKPPPKAAKDLAFAQRGEVQLARLLKEPVPELSIMVAEPTPPQPAIVGEAPAKEPAKEPEAAKDPAAGKGSAASIARDAAKRSGCGCTARDEGPGGAALLALVGLVGLRRRRRAG